MQIAKYSLCQKIWPEQFFIPFVKERLILIHQLGFYLVIFSMIKKCQLIDNKITVCTVVVCSTLTKEIVGFSGE